MNPLLSISAAVALVAFVYSVILTEGGMILNPWYNFLDRKIGESWLFKPLVGCYRCVAGQMAFWYYIVKFRYDIFEHAFFISFAIFTAIVINKLYIYIKQ